MCVYSIASFGCHFPLLSTEDQIWGKKAKEQNFQQENLVTQPPSLTPTKPTRDSCTRYISLFITRCKTNQGWGSRSFKVVLDPLLVQICCYLFEVMANLLLAQMPQTVSTSKYCLTRLCIICYTHYKGNQSYMMPSSSHGNKQLLPWIFVFVSVHWVGRISLFFKFYIM